MSKVGKIDYQDMMDLVLHNQFNEIRLLLFFLERGDSAGMWRHILILIGIFLGPYFTFFKVRRRPIHDRRSSDRIGLRH
jgi:hypothetical protein